MYKKLWNDLKAELLEMVTQESSKEAFSVLNMMRQIEKKEAERLNIVLGEGFKECEE